MERSPPDLIALGLICIRTIPLALLHLVYLSKIYHSSDATSGAVNVALVTVLHSKYCIIASFVPFLKPLVDSQAIGLITSDVHIPLGREEAVRNNSKLNPFTILSGGKPFHTRDAPDWPRFHPSSDYTTIVTGGNDNGSELQFLERYGSQDRMIINRTKTVVVFSDPRHSRRQDQCILPTSDLTAVANMTQME